MIATPTPTKKKNAASRFRSRNGEKKERLMPIDNNANDNSHAPSSKSSMSMNSSYEYTTPIRNANNANNTPKTVPVTPESAFNEWADTASRDSALSSQSRALSPALVDALQMAARPSPTHTNSSKNDTTSTTNGGRSTPLPTYTSSIEAMAAHVEASHLQNKWNKNRQQSKSAKKPTKMSPLSAKILNKNRLRTVSSSTSLSSSKSSSSDGRSTPVTSNRKLLFPRKLYAHTADMSNIPLKKLWLISLPILIPFILCELGIGLLVLLSKDAVVVTTVGDEGGVVVELPLPDVHKDLGRVPVYSYNNVPVEFTPSEESKDKEGGVNDVSTEGELDISIADSSSAVYDEGHDDEPNQKMLDEGFAKLRIASTSNQIQTDTERKIVESHCGNVWEIANDMAIKEASSNGELSSLSSSSINWKALALNSQRCLAASGLSFLSIKDTLDISTRLVVSTKVFDRLSYVEPQDADIRGGLGTALLFQGIFHDDIEESRRLLSLATYHLKVASSLCSTSSRVDDMETAAADILTPVPSRLSEEVINQNSISHTAILHNLALAYLAMGNMKGAVPILLQSAAVKREHSLLGTESNKPYWNVPNDVLQLVEERALLISARPQLEHSKKKKRKRIPFMSMPFDTEQMLDIGVM